MTGLVAFCSPEQFPIVRYKLSLGMLAAVIAVFFDMAAFPYASPDSYLYDDWRKVPKRSGNHAGRLSPVRHRGAVLLFAVACLRRIAVVAVFVLAVSLGL